MSRSPQMEILSRVDALYRDDSRHTKRTWARNRQGGAVDGQFDPKAYSFCFEAAITFVAWKMFGDTVAAKQHGAKAKEVVLERIACWPMRSAPPQSIVQKILRRKPPCYKTIPEFNDQQGLEAVRTVLHELVHS